MNPIYHITNRSAAELARQSGEYRPASLENEGFIHFSQRHQVLGVANAFYRGQSDLVILVVDLRHLTAELKYEAPAHPGAASSVPLPAEDQRFPHLYGPLNFNAVIRVVDFPLSAGGEFTLPDF